MAPCRTLLLNERWKKMPKAIRAITRPSASSAPRENRSCIARWKDGINPSHCSTVSAAARSINPTCVSGYTFGELQAECHVNLSGSQPDKFGFVLIITGVGLSRPLALPPPMCPALFRYDGQQVLNPKR